MVDNSEGRGRLVTLDADFFHDEGFCWRIATKYFFGRGDLNEDAFSSTLRLFEDGQELGPAHSQHVEIRSAGKGRFSHYEGGLWFSSSDNSSPLENGRIYQVLVMPNSRLSSLQAIATEASCLSEASSSADRHAVLKRFGEEIYPEYVFSLHGRAIERDAAFRRMIAPLVDPHFRTVIDRRYAVSQLLRLVVDVPGAVAECGTFNGATAHIMASTLRQLGSPRTFHIFDSFEGLSEPSELDGTHWKKGNLSCDISVAKENLKEFPGIHFHKGWIPNEFSKVIDVNFAFVHIDVDIFQPTRDSLEFFYPRLATGGLFVFDDYGFDLCPGVTKAVDDFFADKPERLVNLPSGGAFLIRR